MLDKVFAAIGMLALIAFMGVVTVYVMEPDLWIVTIVVPGIGVAYFVRELRAGGSHVKGNNDSES
jgi:hypothetical protein